MKRDQEKTKRIRECIKRFYLIVSDKGIADKFGVSELSVKRTRQRMGLKKDNLLSVKLRNKNR